jgi:phage major head subunit gpT-like protein
MGSFKGDHGSPLGITPNLLVVAPSLESAARKLLKTDQGVAGEGNEWRDSAELMVCPWLA